jgi:signal transduction histidine kinase
MAKIFKIPRLSGLNFQFISYFLLFAYIPLFIFSIFGYYLNKNILENAYKKHLIELNQITARNIAEYIERKAENVNTAHYFLSEIGNEENDYIEQLIESTGIDTVFIFGISSSITPNLDVVSIEIYNNYLSIPIISNNIRLCVGIHLDTLKKLLLSYDNRISHFFKLSDEEKTIPELAVFTSEVEEIIESGKTVIVNDTSIAARSSVKNKLQLISVYSNRENYAELREFLFEIIIANILIGIFMAMMAIVLARQIYRPVRSLIAAVHEISSGELSKPINIKGKDEIKQLADEFEIMRQKLLESYANLEGKIDARTKQLKEAQFQISHQEKMASLGLMAAGIAHEIGNPLTSISSISQIIKRKTDDIHITGYITTIAKNIDRISKIVRELVDFARPSSYEAALVNVNDVVQNAVGIVKYDRRAKNLDIELKLENDLPELYLVEDQLYQVFFNILINAVDALVSKKKKKILVNSQTKNNRIYIRFEDNGVGIDPKNKNRIFEPFFTTKGVGKGTGLGLSVSYGIIKNLGGEIQVQSEPDVGSIFTVYLPINKQELINES